MSRKYLLPAALAAMFISIVPATAKDGILSTRGNAFDFSQVWSGEFGVMSSQRRIHVNLTVPRQSGLAAVRKSRARDIVLTGHEEAAKLKSLIAGAEAGHMGYDAIQYGARIKPAKRPTQMTLQEILHWVTTTPGQHHAIGRYQIIPSTLRDLIRRTDLPVSTLFDERTQDHFATLLLHDAGYNDFVAGDLGRDRFMDNLAAIWAGLPTRSGKSAYDGYAGNSATITRADYHRYMSQIFD